MDVVVVVSVIDGVLVVDVVVVMVLEDEDDEEVKAVNSPVDDIVVDGEDLVERTGSVLVPYILSSQSCSVTRPTKPTRV